MRSQSAPSDVALRMDITVELHCDKCGSANLGFPAAEEQAALIACNDCGESHGTLAELRDDLFACAVGRSSQELREGLERMPPS